MVSACSRAYHNKRELRSCAYEGIDDGIDTPSQLSGLNVQMEDNEEEFEPLLGSMQT